MKKKFIGMTEERTKQLEEHPELRKNATEEIWAEMLRCRQRLDEIRMAHYLIYYPMQHEWCSELNDEENAARLASMVKGGWGTTEEVEE